MHQYFEINEHQLSIRCKLYCADVTAVTRVVIFGHGFSGHKDNRAAEKFACRLMSGHSDCALVTFNWPAHGDDEHTQLHLSDCCDYLHQVISHVRRKFCTDELYFYGTSFGGYLALKYIGECGNPFRKIALRAPAVNMYDALTQVILSPSQLELLRLGQTATSGFDRKIAITQSFLDSLRDNDIRRQDYSSASHSILILHGTADEVISCEASRAFAKKNGIGFIPFDHADHRFQDPCIMDQAIERILDFFAL